MPLFAILKMSIGKFVKNVPESLFLIRKFKDTEEKWSESLPSVGLLLNYLRENFVTMAISS